MTSTHKGQVKCSLASGTYCGCLDTLYLYKPKLSGSDHAVAQRALGCFPQVLPSLHSPTCLVQGIKAAVLGTGHQGSCAWYRASRQLCLVQGTNEAVIVWACLGICDRSYPEDFSYLDSRCNYRLIDCAVLRCMHQPYQLHAILSNLQCQYQAKIAPTCIIRCCMMLWKANTCPHGVIWGHSGFVSREMGHCTSVVANITT